MINKEAQERAINKILQESSFGERGFFDSLSKQEKTYFIQILNEISETGKSPSLDLLWELDYDQKPVDIMTFMSDPYYLGNIYNDRLYEGWVPHLKEIYDSGNNYLEVCITGAIGLGKSNIATAGLAYDLHNLLCLKNPQAYYGLTSSSEIVFALFNITLALSGSVGSTLWTDHVNNSPYFRDICTVDRYKKNALIFPKNIKVISGSRFTHALGQNVFAAFLDEVNFGQDVEKGDKIKSQMLDNYTNLLRRMESRFKDTTGRIPGRMFLVSSKKADSDFLENHIRDNKDKPTTYVIDEPIYKIKTHYFDSVTGNRIPRFKGETFRIMIGDQRVDSKLLLDSEDSIPGYEIIEVPIEYRPSFEQDLENSLRDIAGKSTAATTSLIKDRELIRSSINSDRTPIFPVETIYLSFKDNGDQIIDYMDTEEFRKWLAGTEEFPRAIHIDLAISGDSVGIAMGHLSGYKTLSRTSIDLEHEEYTEPTIVVDFMTRIRNIEGQKIPFEKITRFVFDLRSKFGVSIHFVSTDGFQSEYMRQKFDTKGIKTAIISVDKKDDEYLNLRTIHMEGRIDMYEYNKYMVELFSLIRDVKRAKVDHQQKNIDGTPGSKDVSDAVAGLCAGLYKNKDFLQMLSRPTSKQISDMSAAIQEEINKASVKGIPSVHDLMNDDNKEDDYGY